MPYTGPNDPNLPENVKSLPEALQRQWIAVYQSVIDKGGDDGEAMRQANGVLKKNMSLAEIVVYPIGMLKTSKYGDIDFGEDFTAKVLENFNNRVLKIEPRIDIEHEGGKAMGWIKKLFKGSFLNKDGKEIPAVKAEVEWTPDGTNAIKDKHFRYFSAELMSYKDEETGKRYYPVLTGGALTNTPVLKVIPEVSLSQGGEGTGPPMEIELSDIPAMELKEAPAEGALLHPLLEEFDALLSRGEDFWRGMKGAQVLRTYLQETRAKLAAVNLRNMQPEPADKPQPRKEKNMSEIHKLLQLSEEATDEEVGEKLTEILGENTQLSEKVTALEAKRAEDEKDLSKLTEQMTTANQRMTFSEGLTVLTKACEEGRLTPAQLDLWGRRYMSDPEGTREMVESLPQVIELGEHGSSESTEGDKGAFETEVEKTMSEKDVSYGDAVRLVTEKNPELAKTYTEGVK